jgi:hypothetical protein
MDGVRIIMGVCIMYKMCILLASFFYGVQLPFDESLPAIVGWVGRQICCFFSRVYRTRCSPQPRSRAILAVPAESELNGSLYIGFICLRELIGFPPEPCGGAGSLALRLGV